MDVFVFKKVEFLSDALSKVQRRIKFVKQQEQNAHG